MATFNVKEVWATPGAAWQRACALWYSWLPDATKAMIAPTVVTGGLGCKAVRMSYTQGADTYQTDLLMATVRQGASQVPLDYLLNSPGWNAPVRVIDQGYTAAAIQTSFQTYLLPVKTQLYANMTGIATPTWTMLSFPAIVADVDCYQFRTMLQSNLFVGMDATAVWIRLTPATFTFGNDAPPTDGKVSGSPAVIPGGTNVAALTSAVQDLAHRETVAQINNGQFTLLLNSGDLIP